MKDRSDRDAEIETRQARAAYESRASVLNWEDVATRHGYSSGEAARRAVNQHAPQARQPPWPMLDLLEARRARAAHESRVSGLTWIDVAARHGYPSPPAVIEAVKIYAKRVGLPWPGRSAKSGRNAKIVAAVKAGATTTSIAEKYGLSPSGISGIAIRGGARAMKIAKPQPGSQDVRALRRGGQVPAVLGEEKEILFQEMRVCGEFSLGQATCGLQ